MDMLLKNNFMYTSLIFNILLKSKRPVWVFFAV
jgi:hypothetical protein